MNKAVRRAIDSTRRRALKVAGRVARSLPNCLTRCCGCSFFYRARSCEGVAYDPPASDTCPALPDVFVCNNIAQPGTTFKYQGTCYTIFPMDNTEPPDSAVKIADAAQIEVVTDCYDSRCNSNRYFYKATPCSGESLTVPAFYVCVAGVAWDCKVIRFQLPGFDIGCYQLDRSTPIDEDDIPGGSIRIAAIDGNYSAQFDRCCECLPGCETATIATAPCAAPNDIPQARCCCNRTSQRTFTYTLSSVATEGRDGFPPFWSRDTITTVTPTTIICYGDGTQTVNTGTISKRFQFPLDGIDQITNEPLLASLSCNDCHPPVYQPDLPPVTSTACSGSELVGVPGGAALWEWDIDVGNGCFASFRRSYRKQTDSVNPANYQESLTEERWTLVTTGTQRCTGGCDGYTGIPLGRLATPDDLVGETPARLMAALRRLNRV